MRHGRLLRTGAAAVAALAIAPAAALAAPSPLQDTDFSGGTPDENTWLVEPGFLRAKPSVGSTFEVAPTGWSPTLWEPTGTATVADGVVTVNGARFNPVADATATSGVLEFRATFTAEANQHVGFGNDFDDGPWAMFSTRNGSEGLFARTRTEGTDETAISVDTPIPGIDPLQFHVYRIEWTALDVKFYVDGTLVPTPSAVIGGAMRPVISDVQDAADADAVRVDWIAQSPSTNPGTFVSDTFEADDARAVWGTLTATDAAGVTFETRSGNSLTTMSDYQPLGAGGAIQSPPAKLIQYRATLSNADPNTAPRLDDVSITYVIDSTAPATTIGSADATGSTGKVTFSSADTDVARFECSIDNGTFASCTSPKEFTGLAVGSHTVAVRAIDKAGNVGQADSRTFTIAAASGGTNPPGGGSKEDTEAPGMMLASRKLRASSSGKVKLRLTCPADETSCKLSVRLKDGRRTLAFTTGTLAGGETGKVTLRLSSKGRKKLSRRGKLNLKAVVIARDAAGNDKKSKFSVTVRSK